MRLYYWLALSIIAVAVFLVGFIVGTKAGPAEYVAIDVDSGTTAVIVGRPGVPPGSSVYVCNDTMIVASHPTHAGERLGLYEVKSRTK